MSLVIDYTQYSTYLRCPWLWIERYVRNLRRRRDTTVGSDSSLTVGTLVHAGIENYHRWKVPEIPASVVDEANPTQDALQLAQYCVNEWVRTYSGDRWSVEALEEPLTKQLSTSVTVMAKIDSALRVVEPTILTDGWGYEPLVLESGVWAQEYKTKDSKIDRNRWMARWQYDMQAIFQTIVGREKWGDEFRGVVVNVIEKPSQYVPKRKCKGCGKQYEYVSYIACGEGLHSCPMCGEVQKLSALKVDKPQFTGAQFYRFVQQPTERQLEVGLKEILSTGYMMKFLRERIEAGMAPLDAIYRLGSLPNRTECFDTIWGPCEFGQWHVNGEDVEADSPLIEIKDNSKYMSKES